MKQMSSKEIRKKIELYKNVWINNDTTNCYAYALGLDIPEKTICKHAYQPGIMSGFHELEKDYFSYESLIQGLNQDLEFLEIEAKEIDPTDDISPDEWKIALFIHNSIYCPPFLLPDYHFLKYYPDETWHHKFGYTHNISNLDDESKIILNPKSCSIDGFIYDKTLSLKLKK